MDDVVNDDEYASASMEQRMGAAATAAKSLAGGPTRPSGHRLAPRQIRELGR